MRRALMRLWGQTPALNAQWQEWQGVIVSIAPIMAHKQLHWFQDAAAQGYAMPQEFFGNADALANQVRGQWMAKITNHELDGTGAFLQADTQVNAVLASAADQQPRPTGAAQRFPTAGPAIAEVPAGI